MAILVDETTRMICQALTGSQGAFHSEQAIARGWSAASRLGRAVASLFRGHATHILCKDMKNVTLSIDDRLLERARQLAAQRGTSVNAMIRDYLARETSTETEDAFRARMELVARARHADIPRRLMPWTREELYDRGVSGYERDRVRGLGADGGPAEVGESGGDHAG